VLTQSYKLAKIANPAKIVALTINEVTVMGTMNISLPDPLRDWVNAQSKDGLYANNSDYVRDLIRKDQIQKEKFLLLQTAITEGFKSGDAGTLNMRDIKAKARKLETI